MRRSSRRRSSAGCERDLIDALVRSRTVDMLANKDLKVFGRPGETPEAFAARCQSRCRHEGRRRHGETARQVRDQVAGPAAATVGRRRPRQRAGDAGEGQAHRRDLLGRRLHPRRLPRWPTVPRQHDQLGVAAPVQHRGRRRPAGCRGEQDPDVAPTDRGPRAAARRRGDRPSPPSGTRRQWTSAPSPCRSNAPT